MKSVYGGVYMLSSCFEPSKKILSLKTVEQQLHEICKLSLFAVCTDLSR